jgi:hypothetical protein
MWIYHPFKPGAHDARCIYDLGGVSCGRLENHPIHQPPAETATPAEACTGISDRTSAALQDVDYLRAHFGGGTELAALDRIERALRGDGGA